MKKATQLIIIVILLSIPKIILCQPAFKITETKQSFFDENNVKINANVFKERYNIYMLDINMRKVTEDSVVFTLTKRANKEIELLDSTLKLISNKFKDSSKSKILVFWSKSCAPCIKSLPYYDTIWNLLKNKKNIMFFSIVYERKEKLNAILNKYKPSYPIIYDGSLYFDLLKIESIPFVLILNKNNKPIKILRKISFEEISKL